MAKLNIGCGWNKKKGFINIDKASEVNPDKVVNIENGLPFKNNKFYKIYSEHVLEHVSPENWEFLLNEISRVAKPNCILELKLPYDNTCTRVNPFHYRTFTETSFSQLEKGSSRNYYSNLKLEPIFKKPNFIRGLIFRLIPLLPDSRLNWLFGIDEVHLKYKIKKE